jgi:hypothetical protein
MTDQTQSQALEVIPDEVVAAVNSGSITWAALAKALVRHRPTEQPAPPPKLPLPAKINEDQIKALTRLLEIFGSVVPTVRRALEPKERAAIMEERQTLDVVGGMVETRKEGIRTSVLNHNDVTREHDNGGKPLTDAPTDKDGHYLADDKDIITVPDSDRVFSWETSRREPDINLDKLKALADDPAVPEITHADWLAMTTQTRVFDEHKTMTHLKDNPALLSIIARAAEPAVVRGALYVRKAK